MVRIVSVHGMHVMCETPPDPSLTCMPAAQTAPLPLAAVDEMEGVAPKGPSNFRAIIGGVGGMKAHGPARANLATARLDRTL